MSRISVHSSSGILSIRPNSFNLFVTSEWSSGFPYFLLFKSYFAIRHSILSNELTSYVQSNSFRQFKSTDSDTIKKYY